MGVIIATLIVLVVIASALAQDFDFWDYWLKGGNALRSEVVRNLGLLAAAVIGLGFGIWRAWTAHRQAEAAQAQAAAATEQARVANEQARIAQQGQITNLFSTAVEHLGSEQLPVRLGGIYALWRLIKDSPDRVVSVIDILCAFVRHPPHEPAQGTDAGASEDGQASAEMADEVRSTNKIRPDVQTVLDRIGTKNAVYRQLLPAGYRLDLTGANLARAKLYRVNLKGANLMGANLTNANLAGANLLLANLSYADLPRANLSDAELMGSNVTQPQLDSACISKGGKPPTLPEGLNPPQKVCAPAR